MQIKSLRLKNFRNYESAEVEIFSGINLISGKNGQGKTNLVEAAMLCALSKSPRTSRDEDMKKENTSYTETEICLKRDFGDMSIKCIIDDEKGKRFFVNGNEIKKISELFGNLIAVYFSPNDLTIVSGGPSERRDFIDTDISMISGAYYNLILRYNKVLFQRNKLLKMIHEKDKLLDQIGVWNTQLAHLAGLIIKTRKNFIEKLLLPAKEIMQFISKEADDLSISYIGAKGETAEDIENEILKSLENNLERDMELGYTSIGPHRDDIKFELNNHDSRIFASQGQQRSIVLALKLAEMRVFEKEIGEKPILILDDVFSELDSIRQKKLYEIFEDSQVLMTGTLFKFKPLKNYMNFVVKEAKIKSQYIEK